MLNKSDVAGHPMRSRILILVLSLALLGTLSYVCLELGALRDRRPLPDTPIAVHHRDCIWILDGDANVVTHGPYCLSGLWKQVGIGDVEVVPNGHLYASFSYEQVLDSNLPKTVVEFDPTSSKKIREIEVPVRPGDIVRMDDHRLYVGVGTLSTREPGLAVIDTETNAVVKEIALDLPCGAEKVVLGFKKRLYVSSCWALAAVDVEIGTVSYHTIDSEPMIYDMAIDSNGYLYLLIFDEIQVLDPENWEMIVSTGQDPDLTACEGRSIATVDGKAFVACLKQQAIMAYDPTSNTVTPIPLPDQYTKIVAASEGKLYLLQRDAEEVLVLDALSDEVLTEVPLPKSRR